MSVFAKGHVPWVFNTIENTQCNQILGSYSSVPNITFYTSDGKITPVAKRIIPKFISYSNQTSGLVYNAYTAQYGCQGRENSGIAVVDNNGDVYLQAPKFYNWLNAYDSKPYATIFNPFSSWPEFTGKKWVKVLLAQGLLVGLTTTGEIWTIANDVYSRYSGNRYSTGNANIISGSGSKARYARKAKFDSLDGIQSSIFYDSFDNSPTITQYYYNTVDFYRPQKIDIYDNIETEGMLTLGTQLEGPSYLSDILNNKAGITSCDSVSAGSWLYNDKLTYAKIAEMYGYRYVSAAINIDANRATNYSSPTDNYHRYWNGSSFQCVSAVGKQWLTSITLTGKITNNWKDVYITYAEQSLSKPTIIAINTNGEMYGWGYNNNHIITNAQSSAVTIDTPTKITPHQYDHPANEPNKIRVMLFR